MRVWMVLALVVMVAACGRDPGPTPVAQIDARPAEAPVASEKLNPRLLRRFKSVRPELDVDGPLSEEQITLGRMLYFDPRLSKDRDLSCNSCHRLTDYGVDGARTSLGRLGQRGARNSPTVYHAAGHFAQFWDGRSATVEEQAKVPILNPIEMGMRSTEDVVAMLRSIPGYAAMFREAFPGIAEPVTFNHAAQAIGAFERRLVTPSRWDRFVAGDEHALSTAEIQGFKVFTDLGCMSCHTGEFLGGSSFQKAGAVVAWPNQRDQGRFEVTKEAIDRMMFKVPSLRNIAKTAPYFHDGSAATLAEAVKAMGFHQLGIELTDDEIGKLTTWMGSLTGELPLAYIEPPDLPPDGPTSTAVAARFR